VKTRLNILLYFLVLSLLVFTACEREKPTVGEELERDVETLNNRVTALNNQLQDLRKSIELLQKDIDARSGEIQTALKNIESSRIEAQIAVEEVARRIKGERKLTVAEKKVLPTGVRVLIFVILIILIAILIKMALSKMPESVPSTAQSRAPEEEKKSSEDKT